MVLLTVLLVHLIKLVAHAQVNAQLILHPVLVPVLVVNGVLHMEENQTVAEILVVYGVMLWDIQLALIYVGIVVRLVNASQQLNA
jgi:hypothetical protein